MNVEIISKILKEKGIKPSYQRIKILELMLNCNCHPTVDDIYLKLINEIPTLSRATVYNTVNKYVEADIIHKVKIDDENEARYDAILDLHGHFKCASCKRIYDFKVNESISRYEDLKGFHVDQRSLQVSGICPSCKNK